jgi:O-antigen/teichoic acid export membrane protein
MFALSAPLVIVLGVFGRDLIRLMYDARYQDAGWILELLAVGALFFAVGAPLRALPMALGDPKRYMWQQVATVITLMGAMSAGAFLGGFHGLIAGIAVANALEYCVVRVSVRKYRVGDLSTDLLFAGGMLAIILGAWAVRGLPSAS